MALIDELQAQVDQLQADLDAKQEQIANAIASLKQTIADLQALLEGSVSQEALQEVVNKVQAISDDLNSTPVE